MNNQVNRKEKMKEDDTTTPLRSPDKHRKAQFDRRSRSRSSGSLSPGSRHGSSSGGRSRSRSTVRSSRSHTSLRSRGRKGRHNKSKDRITGRSSGERKRIKKRPLSADDIRLFKDENVRSLTSEENRKDSTWEASDLQKSGKGKKNQLVDERTLEVLHGVTSRGAPLPSSSPSGAGEKRGASRSRSRRRVSSPDRKKGKQGRHQKNGDKPKSGRPSNNRSKPTSALSTVVATDTVGDDAKAFTAETVDEQSETNTGKRMRDLEVQSDQIQQQMQHAMVKSKKGKKGDERRGSARNGARRMTIYKVVGIAAVYLAGVGTGYLLSELRQRKASPAKEIYVTQSPTSAVVPSNDPTIAPTEFSYDDPTEEDCFAIESKEEVEGQDGMITKSYDVHFDVQLNDASTNWYEQLEVGATDDVIPDLACCKVAPTDQRRLIIESPSMKFSFRGHNRMLRNIRCVVANGSSRGEYNDNGESCVELTGGLCLPAVVTFDLTLKGDEPDGDIIDLVRNVINGDGSEPLVEKFDLDRNVFSVVKLVDVVDHDPSEAPVVLSPTTSMPTLAPTVTSAPVVGPTTNAPTRVATQPPIAGPTNAPTWGTTQSPVTLPETPKPTIGATQSPTTAPAPGVTPRPTPGPSAQPAPGATPPPTSEPSRRPTESPSTSPTLDPTLVASSSPSISPTTPEPSETPSAAPTGRREVLEAILTPLVASIDTSVLDWLADTDTWSPPTTEADPDAMWLERYAMAKFYLATNGDSWTDKGGWMTSASICDWTADICNNNRITEMKLNGNGLSGTIPTEIGLCSNLETLGISENSISGKIPSELGLTAMTNLDIEKNALTGSIPPEVLSSSSLRVCLLKDNQLSGTIGSEIGAMTELLNLSMERNPISGSLPSELGLLTKLTYMSIQGCSFTGSIPSELGRATMLATVDFDNNGISGTIPTTLGRLIRCRSMDLDKTSLSGPVPSELGRLTALVNLDLERTNLSGTVPTEINELTNLKHFRIDNTQVSGSIPDLRALVNVNTLGFANCQLSGSIPAGMFDNMRDLTKINFSQNSLTGAIPALPNPSSLTTCLLNDNCFGDVTNAPGTCDLTNNCV